MIRKFIIIPLLLNVLLYISADETDLLLDSDFEDIFTVIEDVEQEEQEDTSLLEDVLKRETFVIKSDYYLSFGLLTGSSDFNLDLTYTPYLSIDSTFSLESNINENLTAYQKVKVSYPLNTFDIKEFFMDTNFSNVLFLRIGKQSTNWGSSPFYEFSNLPRRFTGSGLSLNLKKPISVGGVSTLLTVEDDNWTQESAPEFEDIYMGVNVNTILHFYESSFDIQLGYLYNEVLKHNLMTSVSTTLFGDIEVTSDVYLEIGDEFYATFSLGFFNSFLNNKLTIAGEYLYNSAESISNPVYLTLPLLKGNSLTLLLDMKTFKNKLSFQTFSIINYESTLSSIIVPGIEWHITNFMKLNLITAFFIDYDSDFTFNGVNFNNKKYAPLINISIKGSV